MAQKNTKLVGNILGQSRQYWETASKQFVWPIDFIDLQILVPEKDLSLAGNDLMVTHFRAAGWHIQSVMSVAYTKPFVAPENKGPIFIPIKKEIVEKETEFKLSQKFKVLSTECELQIFHIEKGKIHLKYLNRPAKHDIISSEENLLRVLRLNSWIRL